MSILRTIVILANVIIFGWLIWSVATEGGLSGGEWFWFLSLLLTIVLNMLFIITSKGEDNWITLFLKRKALEEKKRIADLENKKE